MLEERTYWVLAQTRWMEPEHRAIASKAWFGTLPNFIRSLITRKIVKNMRSDMRGHGIGCHTPEEIYAFGLKDLRTFEALPGDKPFLLGDKPSEYDATGYGFLANIMAKPFPSPMTEYIAASKALSAYIERVDKKTFG